VSADTFVLTSMGQVQRLTRWLLGSLTFAGGRAWCVTVERVDPRHTDGQRKLLRAIEGEMASHTGYEKEELHDLLLAGHYGTKRLEVMRGLVIEVPARRTSDMNREEMTRHIDWVKDRAESMGMRP
jgi:hypothetical protein